MNRMVYLATVAVALASVGCSKHEQRPAAERPITITTAIRGMEEQSAPQLEEDGSGAFADGDTFTLYVYGADGSSSAIDYTLGATTLYWRELPFAAEGTTVNFAACYPVQRPVEGRFGFDLEQASDPDLLVAAPIGVAAGTERPVGLTFRHAMHRLIVAFSTTDADVALDAITTVCRAKASCTVDLTEGVLDTTGARTAAFTEQGARAAFLVVPQDPADVSLEIRLGDQIKRYRLDELAPACGALAGGKQLTVKLGIRNGQIQLDDCVIEGWGDQGTIEGEIIL